MAELDYLDAEARGINYLHSLEHFQNCLFFATIDGADDSKFRISRISVTSPSLSFERNNNRYLALKNTSIPEEVTITWVEDAYRSVEQFHLRWMRYWYDFEADYIPIGRGGKFKNITIYAYHYINKNNSISAPLMDAEPTMTLTLGNCVPTNMGSSIEFDWSAGGIKEFNTTYKFAKVTGIVYESPKRAATSADNWAEATNLYSSTSNLGLGGAYTGPKDKSWGSKPEEAWSGVEGAQKPFSYTTDRKTVEALVEKDRIAAIQAESQSTGVAKSPDQAVTNEEGK